MKKLCDLTVIPRTREHLSVLGASHRRPIIVGPWLSEIGFELLYWIPFLRWACAFAGLKPEDLWIVSRGGCDSWYADISPHYLDVFSLYDVKAFRAGNAGRIAEQTIKHGRASTKQHVITAFDTDIIARVGALLGVVKPTVLHPSLMYALFRPFWLRQAPETYTEMTSPRRLSAPPRLDGLPTNYVAAKFYASNACPDTPLNRRAVNACVRAVAETTNVILLHSGTRYDDHGDFPIDAHPRVHRMRLDDPATNLATQTAVIADARSYIGTYGGFAYLAPFLGVPARTFYVEPNFRKDHRQLMDAVARQLRVPFSVELVGGGAVVKRPRRLRAGRHAA